MRKKLLVVLVVVLCASLASAQLARQASHMKPTGKGWGEEDKNAPQGDAPPGAVVTGNGISYHGGPVMQASTIPVYYIWYGNWTNGPKPSDSSTTVSLLNTLFGIGGIGGSPYFNINQTYGDNSGDVSGGIQYQGSTTDSYSQGTRLSDNGVQTVVANAINSGRLPKDGNAIYFVLTSSDVRETSGFCTRYCGWHTHGTIGGIDIKYSFVGNPDRCSSACEAQTISPNGDSGADGMASIMAHEAEEAATDPDLNAWYDSSGAENADKCAWKFGPTGTAGNGSKYNQTFSNGNRWLIQMNWENARGGGCDQVKGGTFYTQ